MTHPDPRDSIRGLIDDLRGGHTDHVSTYDQQIAAHAQRMQEDEERIAYLATDTRLRNEEELAELIEKRNRAARFVPGTPQMIPPTVQQRVAFLPPAPAGPAVTPPVVTPAAGTPVTPVVPAGSPRPAGATAVSAVTPPVAPATPPPAAPAAAPAAVRRPAREPKWYDRFKQMPGIAILGGLLFVGLLVFLGLTGQSWWQQYSQQGGVFGLLLFLIIMGTMVVLAYVIAGKFEHDAAADASHRGRPRTTTTRSE